MHREGAARVELVAILPDLQLARLRAAVPAGCCVHVLESLDGANGLATTLEHRQVDLVILDPGDRRLTGRAQELTELLDRYYWTPVVLYTALTSAGIKPSTELLRHGVRGFVLAGFDDQASGIRALVERLTADAVSDQLLTALHRPLAAMPVSVARAIRALFGAPQRFGSVEDLASAAGLTSRHLSRVVHAVGLTSSAQILVVARVLRAYLLLKPDRVPLDSVAERLRMDPRVLSRHIRLTGGVPTASALRTLAAEELVSRCVRTLYRPPAAMNRITGTSS
jgi:AraC-like DNA-binding protein